MNSIQYDILINMDAEFIRRFIKGKIAEIIFEQMFRESGKYTVLHSGYEYTLPELAQYQHLVEVKAVIENIQNAPDFVLVSNDKTEVHLIEVKYRRNRDQADIKEHAESILKTWNPSWMFIASPDGFFFEPCNTIVANNGAIGKLYDKWVTLEVQAEYLKLLNEFEPKGQRSVDFVVCEKEYLSPVLTIELNDNSHNLPDRIERDHFAETALQEGGLPLLTVIALSNQDYYDVEKLKYKIRDFVDTD